ncbi:hypothetical protein [Coleofasciculus sp. G2-EDA-02]|uniref:hypothetical protein n=1 Tax=Coleofasciculus sp. G2-EDA-02 TaxID=3069529 RepID=UPI0032F62786
MDSAIIEIIVAVAVGLYVSKTTIDKRFVELRGEMDQLKSSLDRRCDEIESLARRVEAATHAIDNQQDKNINISITHKNANQFESDADFDDL